MCRAMNRGLGPMRKRMIMTMGRYRNPALGLFLVVMATAACSKHETSKDDLLVRARAAFAEQRYLEAAKDYNEVLRLEPANQAAIRELGIIYDEQGQVIQAYSHLLRAAEVQPNDLEVKLRLGRLYLANNDLPRARDAAIEILTKKVDDQQALLLLVDAT